MKVRKDQLTERQQMFCRHYVGEAHHNSARAARLAGYAASCSHVTGCQLLQKPKIAATVRDLEAAVAEEMGYTRERLIRDLLEAADMARLTGQPAALIAAAVAIARAAGLDKPAPARVAVNGAGAGDFEAMTDAELRAMIAGGETVKG